METLKKSYMETALSTSRFFTAVGKTGNSIGVSPTFSGSNCLRAPESSSLVYFLKAFKVVVK